MVEFYDVLLRGGTVVTATACGEADIAISAGRIVSRRAGLSPQRARRVLDMRGLHLLPGVIDSHVHFRSPGLEHKEDFMTGSRAAVLGGVCCVFDMPNTAPPCIDGASFHAKMALAREKMFCDYGFYVGAHRQHYDSLPQLERLDGCVGVKVFMGSSTGALLIDDDETLRQILSVCRRRISVHSEDEGRLRQRYHDHAEHWAALWGVGAHGRLRDVRAAVLSSQRFMALLAEQGRLGHILHISSADELDWFCRLPLRLRRLCSFEVTPHHLTFSSPSCFRQAQRLGCQALAVVNPPLRSERHRQALWQAVGRGVIDTIGSDHAPHTYDEKASMSYPSVPSGMTGVQHMLAVMLDHCHQGRLDLRRLVAMTSANVVRLYGLRQKGFLQQGFDADITVVDRKARRRIGDDAYASKAGWSLYEGRHVVGWPMMTFVRGRLVMREGTVLGKPEGQPCSFSSPQ